jgi:hypothetical protein
MRQTLRQFSTGLPSTQERPFALPLNENEIQRAVFRHFATRGAPTAFAFHPKNGGIHQRGRRAGINTGLGVVPGVPDVIVLYRGHCFTLELKAEKGKLSPEQLEIAKTITRAGGTWGVAYGLDEALRWLEERGLLVGKTA